MTKEILLVIPGTGEESIGHRVMIEPDTTVADLFTAANLNPREYMLQVQKGDKRLSLQSEERVFEHVQAGDKVFATPANIVVGLAR